MFTSTFQSHINSDRFTTSTSALEKGLERHATYPTLEPTYNPPLLARTPSISSDIRYYLQVDDWQSHPLHKNLLSISFSAGTQLSAYINRINGVANQQDPSLLLAYSYLSYMGNLSGGQVARHNIAKAYGLDEAAKSGIALYSYKELTSAKPASLGEMKRIKEWFRKGMDLAGNHGGDKLKGNSIQFQSCPFLLIFRFPNVFQPKFSRKPSGHMNSTQICLIHLMFSSKENQWRGRPRDSLCTRSSPSLLQVSLSSCCRLFFPCHRLPCSVFFALYPCCRRFHRETRISEMAHSRTMDEEHVVDTCRLDYFKDTIII